MSWEWIAPSVTGAVGALGVTFTWLTGHQGRKHAERVMRETHAHARQIAADQRRQERIGDAYKEILEFLATMHFNILELSHRSNESEEDYFRRIAESRSSVVPDGEDLIRIMALIDAYGSKPVRQLFDLMLKGFRHLLDADLPPEGRERITRRIKECYHAMSAHMRAELLDSPLDRSEIVISPSEGVTPDNQTPQQDAPSGGRE